MIQSMTGYGRVEFNLKNKNFTVEFKSLNSKTTDFNLKIPVISACGSEFIEKYVVIGASRNRKLFSKAKRSKTCIIFIDEIDAMGRHRGAGFGGGNDEREQTVNQLLVEMTLLQVMYLLFSNKIHRNNIVIVYKKLMNFRSFLNNF